MATKFDVIYNHFTSLVNDYKINNLFKLGESDLNDYLEPSLLSSVTKFAPYCRLELINNIDYANQEFEIDLSLSEIVILANLMVEHWFMKEINNALQINAKLSDTDFKHYAEGQNLSSKKDRLATIQENNAQMIQQYQLNYYINWDEWRNGYYNG